MAQSLQQQLKKKRSFDLPEEEVGLNIQRSYSVLMGPAFQLLKAHQLSPPLYNILRILRGVGGDGLPCSQIGDRMVTREPDVTRLIDRLEQSSLVQRIRSTEDRRVVMVSITKEGGKLLAKLDEPIRELHRNTLGHLTQKEMNDLNRLLVKARQEVEALA